MTDLHKVSQNCNQYDNDSWFATFSVPCIAFSMQVKKHLLFVVSPKLPLTSMQDCLCFFSCHIFSDAVIVEYLTKARHMDRFSPLLSTGSLSSSRFTLDLFSGSMMLGFFPLLQVWAKEPCLRRHTNIMWFKVS